MSQLAPISITSLNPGAPAAAPSKTRSVLHHAKLISALTLASRILGVLREGFAAKYFGAGLVSTAFTVAFTIPNLFRRLLGEGALSAAFIPLYAQSLNSNEQEAKRFASAAVNLLVAILVGITILGELLILTLYLTCTFEGDRLLALKLTAVMLPYVLLVCGQAFLGAILQVHRRFGMTAATPIILNLALIASTIAGAKIFDLHIPANQIRAIYLVSVSVLIAGVLQVWMLLPTLQQVGFRFQLAPIWTPAIQKMLKLSLPIALGAAVLQISVLIDRGLSLLLAQSIDSNSHLITRFSLFGHNFRYPMQFGAAARLAWAQYLYQFPLGVFATALATAIFPALSADALDTDRAKFLNGLGRGIRVTLWEGLPASVGLILVAQPAVQLLFERGKFLPTDTALVALSVQVYSAAIWAFSLQLILSRAYYALHDTWTPLLLSLVTLLVNCIVEIPLLWTKLGEAGMAAGTTVSFTLQTLLMLYFLGRKTGHLGLSQLFPFIAKLLLATAAMAVAVLLVQKLPFFPHNASKSTALVRLSILTATGATTYLTLTRLLGAWITSKSTTP
jgi:putative peptidoglycan lipid II flippase